MAKSADPTADRSTVRKIVTVICLLAVAGLFTVVARQSWRSSTAAGEVVALEANGADMMHAMTTLLTQMVTAQSAAVRGEPINVADLESALDRAAEPDRVYGRQLRTNQRMADLRSQVDLAVGSQVTGAEAYVIWSSIVDLTVDLIHVIGDTSHLVHDPDLDSYYLMEAAIVHLPRTMVYAGRASDIVALAGGRELEGEDLVRAAVARFNVSLDAELVFSGLTTSVDFTQRSELGTNIAPRLDAFRAAADEFSPPTMLQELAAEVDAATMADNASRVLASAGSLSHLLLSELQALLEARSAAIERDRRATLIASGAAAVIALALIWLVLAGRSARRSARSADEPTTGARALTAVGTATVGPPHRASNGGGDLADAGARRSGHAR